MKYICSQMHDIQTDGESLTLCRKHAALFENFLVFIDIFGCRLSPAIRRLFVQIYTFRFQTSERPGAI